MKNHFVQSNSGGYWNGATFATTRDEALMMSKQVAMALSRNHAGSRVYRITMRKNAPLIENDGGLAASGIQDTNNCTIRSLAIAANIPYALADEIGTAAGRKRRNGMPTKHLMTEAIKWGIGCEEQYMTSKITIGQFIKSFPQGRFICRKSKHAFAVIDGVVHDSGNIVSMMGRITNYWKITTYGVQRTSPIFTL